MTGTVEGLPLLMLPSQMVMANSRNHNNSNKAVLSFTLLYAQQVCILAVVHRNKALVRPFIVLLLTLYIEANEYFNRSLGAN